jgi:hypothetical protein
VFGCELGNWKAGRCRSRLLEGEVAWAPWICFSVATELQPVVKMELNSGVLTSFQVASPLKRAQSTSQFTPTP